MTHYAETTLRRKRVCRRQLLVGAAAAALGLGAVPTAARDQPRIGVVAEIGGIPLCDAKEAGIKERAAALS